MPNLNSYRYDEEKSQEGVWFKTIEGLQLKIARAGNVKAARLTRKLGVENQRRLRRTDAGDLMNDLGKQVAAKHILVGWKDIEDDNGVPIPYSSEKALQLFNEYEEFYVEVMEYAGRDDEFRDSMVEEAVKN